MNEIDDSTPASPLAAAAEPPASLVSPQPDSGTASPPIPSDATPRRGLPPQAKIAAVLGLAIVLAFFLWPRAKSERRFEDGYLMDEKGSAVALATQLEPATLVHFWATWCPPCRQEIPSLLAFADEVGPGRLKLVLVAVADESDRAVQFVSNPRYPVLFDPVWDVARRFRTVQLPETHLVLDGKLSATFIGAADWRNSVARRTVLARLDERAAKAGTPGR
ncbi:MAG: TlpA disulfide reductase family protein [Thermoanaerobaculia bacterium]